MLGCCFTERGLWCILTCEIFSNMRLAKPRFIFTQALFVFPPVSNMGLARPMIIANRFFSNMLRSTFLIDTGSSLFLNNLSRQFYNWLENNLNYS